MLKIQNLSYAYKKIQALKDVSFSLQDGEIMSIIGANGAGKSTLMKCIAGVLKTDSGSVILDDFPLAQKPHQVVRSGIVLVPEGRWIFPGLSVEENLNIGAYVLGGNPQGKERAFHMFPKLKERRDQRAGTLSGGEQQMLAIARGLMSNPKIIMLDEPFAGVDPIQVEEIQHIVWKLKYRNIGILITDHNVRETLACVDRAYLMCKGEILCEGASDFLINDPEARRLYLGPAFTM